LKFTPAEQIKLFSCGVLLLEKIHCENKQNYFHGKKCEVSLLQFCSVYDKIPLFELSIYDWLSFDHVCVILDPREWFTKNSPLENCIIFQFFNRLKNPGSY